MAVDMEARKKAGPFLPKWSKVKGRHKALSSGNLFKPDITPAITRYDKTLDDFDDLKDDQDKLKAVVVGMSAKAGEAGKERDSLMKQVTDLSKAFEDSTKKDVEQLVKSMGNQKVDPAEVLGALNDIVSVAEPFVNKRKSLWEEIDGVTYESVLGWKKARDDYKKQADTLAAKQTKIETEAANAQAEIEKILDNYASTADEMDHDDIVKDLKTLKCV
jgi:uncharacterized coiled-coil DUF342 family protein